MYRNYLALLFVTVLAVCCSNFVAANITTKKTIRLVITAVKGTSKGSRAQEMMILPSSTRQTKRERAINFDDSKFKSLSKSMPNLEKLKSMTGLQRLESLSKTMSKLSKMKKSRSVNQAELMEMRRFANQDPDLIKIKPLVGTNPTKVSAEQLKVVQSYLKKHPKEGPNVVEWMVGASFLFIALFSAGMVKEIAS